MDKYLKRLCNAIIAGRFNDENYRQRKSYYGIDIMTEPLFCSYGTIGFTATIYADTMYEISYDWDIKELLIDDKPWKDAINIIYLENNDMEAHESEPWDDKPRSVEFECYTDAGEDMLITLEVPTKEQLQKYIDDFDINEKVLMWWENGKPGRGVPFDNIKEHYEDYEDYLKWLQKICDKMPF